MDGWRTWTLHDAIRVPFPAPEGCYWTGTFLVAAPDRHAAEVTVRIHHACLLHQAGRL